jgi:chaperonin GroEL
VKNISTRSNLINIGIDLVKKVAHSANELCGDGTTTSAILTTAILRHGNYYLKAGVNPILMYRGIMKAKKIVESFLSEITIVFNYKTELEKLRCVAMVATNYDEHLADLISRAVHVVGPHGQIFIEPSNVYGSDLTIIEGGSIAKGIASQHFILKDAITSIHFAEPLVLLLNFEIESQEFTSKIFDFAKANPHNPIIVFCQHIDDKCLSQAVFQRTNNDMKICVVEIPFQGEMQAEIFEDFAALFDAKVIDYIEHLDLEDLNIEYFGKVIREGE